MFALSAARDLAIAIIVTLILSAALDGISRREARQSPVIHSGVAIAPQNRDAAGRAADRVMSTTISGAVASSAKHRR